jgi:hypothetical protein
MERVFRLPNKRYAAINDTWARPEYSGAPPQVSTPHLLGGMGYAILGMGRDEKQLQAHLKFSGRFGHEHYDSLNLLLFGAGRELVSDLGYTHTIARPWTMTTAAHNTVLVDGENQSAGAGAARALGNVLLFNADDPDFQVVQANAPGAYAKATTYQRALIAVRAPDGTQYVADVFDVAGGAQHDWILHGSADDEQSLELQNAQTHEPLSMQPQASLLPADFSFTPLTKQGQYALIRQGAWALGNFRDAQSATSGQSVQATFRFKSDTQRGLRTWIIGAPDTTYATARAWSVRGTGMPNHENDAKLNDHLRAALIVRRPGASHRFVAVHHPFSGELKVKSVESIAMQPDGVALKIERAGGTDYLLWGGDEKPRSGRLDDIPFSFDGRVALIHRDGDQTVLKMMGGTRLQCGDKVLAGKPAAPAALLGVEGNRLRVAGALPAKPGAVVLVAHGDGSRNAFHVAKAEYSQGETIITTQERAALSGEAAGEMTLLTFPHLKYPAPHRVEMTVLSSSAG